MNLITFFLIIVNPMIPNTSAYGPNHDWAPLKAQYSMCAEESHSSFSFFVCSSTAKHDALNPTVSV